jgi:hypothetical protein
MEWQPVSPPMERWPIHAWTAADKWCWSASLVPHRPLAEVATDAADARDVLGIQGRSQALRARGAGAKMPYPCKRYGYCVSLQRAVCCF